MNLFHLCRESSSLLLLLASTLIDMTSATLYRTGSDVTITCSKQTKFQSGNEYSFDPSLDVKLASDRTGGFATLFTGASPRPETDLSKWSVETSGDDFVYTLSSAELADAGEYKCNNIIDDLHSITIVGGVVVCPNIDASTAGYQENTILNEICTLDKAGRDPIRLLWSSSSSSSTDNDASSSTSSSSSSSSFTSNFDAASSTLMSTLSFNLSSTHHDGAFTCSLDAPDDGFDDLRCDFGPINVEYGVRAAVDGNRIDKTIDEDIEASGRVVAVTLIGNPSPVPGRVSVSIDPALPAEAASSGVSPADDGGAVVVSLNVDSDAVAKTPLGAASVNISYDDVVVKRFTFHSSSVATVGGGGGGGGSAGAIAGVVFALVLIAICGVLLVILWKKRILFNGKNESEAAKLEGEEEDVEKGFASAGEEKQAEPEEVKMTDAEEEMKKLVVAEPSDSTEKPDLNSVDNSPTKPSETAA